jgi:DNA-binding NarL/FixJ family response regulator
MRAMPSGRRAAVTAPLLLVDDGPSATALVDAGRRRMAERGWTVIDGLDTRPAMMRATLHGVVATPRDAASALLAALDGFGLLLVLAAEADMRDRLVDDLRRVGRIEHLDATSASGADGGPLSDDGRAILALLAEGHTLGGAAHRLALSRRTADRRLAEARDALGVTRTTEAIAIAARRGLLRPPG